MGLRSWIKRHTGHGGQKPSAEAQIAVTAAKTDTVTAADCDGDVWEPLPAFLPVDPHEHTAACVIASAIAAGNHPNSEFRVKRMLVANPEHRTVSVIATALAAGALEKSSFMVKNIYKMKEEGSHAA